jgi:TRAP-type C4-dicarboxylate transport system permease small subunit
MIDGSLNRLEGWLLVLFLTVMVGMAFLQVVLRNVFSGGIIWGDVLLRHLVLWIGFLGAALATSHDRHIGIDAFTRFLSPRLKSLTRVLTQLFAAVICLLLADAARNLLGYEIEDGRELFLGIPEWYSQVIIPVGFTLLTIHFLVRVISSVRDLFARKQP